MDKIPILIIIMAPLLLPCLSERQNFPLSENATWDAARSHCQVCYKDLVTVSYDNVLELVQGVARRRGCSWVGLREEPGGEDPPWSRWANGDPLIFQNWYPGKRQYVAGTTAAAIFTVPETTTPGFAQTTDDGSATHTAAGGSPQPTYGYPPQTKSVTGSYGNYGNEACVAMLSSGPWLEIGCTEKLPYICYDDSFDSVVSVNMSARDATLSWAAAPGNISSYRVEVRGGENSTYNATGLTLDLSNLTTGAHYAVRVVPVKCGRDLNSQDVSFFTKPGSPRELVLSNLTANSLVLSWDPPEGNANCYHVAVQGVQGPNTSELRMKVVRDFNPGTCYTLQVFSVVGDKSVTVRSDPANVTVITKPSNVFGVTVTKVTTHSLLLSWSHSGNAKGYRVVAKDNLNHEKVLFDDFGIYTNRTVKNTSILAGTQLWLTVAAVVQSLDSDSVHLEGDGVTVCSYIAPNPISSLVLKSTADTICASWLKPIGHYECFNVTVQLEPLTNSTSIQTINAFLNLTDLRTAANYTVTVTTVAGNLTSMSVSNFTYTKPVMPSSLSVSTKKHHATVTWTAPTAASTTQYLVTYNASFWNHSEKILTNGSLSLNVSELKPSTWYMFKVYTVSGDLKSTPAQCKVLTDGDKRNITLSMLCSSAKPLLCDDDLTKNEVLQQLTKYFEDVLNNVFLKLEWKGQ